MLKYRDILQIGRLAAFLCISLLLSITALVSVVAQEGEQEYLIEMQARSWVPEPTIDPFFKSVLGGPSFATRFTDWFATRLGDQSLLSEEVRANEAVHGIIQFHSELSFKDHQLLASSGIGLESDLGANAYFVSLKFQPRDSEPISDLIRHAGLISGEFKIDQSVFNIEDDEQAVRLEDAGQAYEVLVVFFSDVTEKRVAHAFQEVAVEGELYGADNSWRVNATRSQIESVAEFDIVKAVAVGPSAYVPLNADSRALVGTDSVNNIVLSQSGPIFRGPVGKNIKVAVSDLDSIDEAHKDFGPLNAAGTSPIDCPSPRPRIYSVRAGGAAHATLVASILGGNGTNSHGHSLRGHAPQTCLGDYPDIYGDVIAHFGALVSDGSHIMNHSYAQTTSHKYDNTAASLDKIIRGSASYNGQRLPQRPQVWAAGNSGLIAKGGPQKGYYSVFTTAKNTISVGSVDTLDGRLSSFSSLGPTFDGRIKPDIVAPGCADSIIDPWIGIKAAKAGSQAYAQDCGTSFAAPVVAATVALMMDVMGSQVSAGVRPSMYKAIIVQTALDLKKPNVYASREIQNADLLGGIVYYTGPDFATGFGLLQTAAAVDLAGKPMHLDEVELSVTNRNHEHCVAVESGELLKVTIAWDDVPGDPQRAITSPQIVNDLDLILESPDADAQPYLPWTLEPLPLSDTPTVRGVRDPISYPDLIPAQPGQDRRNNVEMVTKRIDQSGLWRIGISIYRLGLGGTQIYSLAASHPLVPCS